MREQPFEVKVDDGILKGHRGGEGPPALLLHGGAAVPDYTGDCAALLGSLFSTMRYTQRGTPPSTGGPPYSIESHMADALAVLDALEIDCSWAIGHSWGGHLALHLLVAHPERLLGVLCIDPLGAHADLFRDFDANLRRRMTAQQVARIDEIEARRRAGQVTESELFERFEIIWPHFFADPDTAPPNPVRRIGVQSSIETNRSIAEHLEQGTLVSKLPHAALPALFVHGLADPLPARSSSGTAALVPRSSVETIADCGHFPWLERPKEFQRAVQRLLERVSQ